MRGIVACLLSSIVLSCSSIGKVPRDSGAKSKIYVLRHYSVRGGGDIIISDNGKSVGTSRRGSIVSWERPPGTAVIAASGANEARITLVVEANKVYYVETKATHGTKEHPKEVELHILSESEGSRLLRMLQTKPIPPHES
ncbi:MAG: hypothetical protein QOG67_136 [Verrucomicrobiota bacterium]